jgi:hypothetical protein
VTDEQQTTTERVEVERERTTEKTADTDRRDEQTKAAEKAAERPTPPNTNAAR